jgi:hypothetical protein
LGPLQNGPNLIYLSFSLFKDELSSAEPCGHFLFGTIHPY